MRCQREFLEGGGTQQGRLLLAKHQKVGNRRHEDRPTCGRPQRVAVAGGATRVTRQSIRPWGRRGEGRSAVSGGRRRPVDHGPRRHCACRHLRH